MVIHRRYFQSLRVELLSRIEDKCSYSSLELLTILSNKQNTSFYMMAEYVYWFKKFALNNRVHYHAMDASTIAHIRPGHIYYSLPAILGHIWCKSWWVVSASVAGSYWHGAYTSVICNRSCMSMYRSCEWKTIFHSNLWGFSLRCLSRIYDRPPSVYSSTKHKSPKPTSTSSDILFAHARIDFNNNIVDEFGSKGPLRFTGQ